MFRSKVQKDVSPIVNIETTQPLELVHFDYLQIVPSKGNIENVLIITDHFTRYEQAFPSKTQNSNSYSKTIMVQLYFTSWFPI